MRGYKTDSKRKAILFVLLTLFLGIFSFNFIFAFSGAGDGSNTNPYKITNCTQLQEVKEDLKANYILMNSIDCSDTINWNSGAGFEPIGKGDSVGQYFFGTFNGRNNKIINLYSNFGGYLVGLFGYLGSSGNISNVNLENVNIKTTWMSGGLVANNDGTIDNCFSTGHVKGGSLGTGGLVGKNNGLINNSYSHVPVTGTFQRGGLVGINYGVVSNSYSTGYIGNDINVGGLVGWSETGYGTVINSFWDMETSGRTTSAGGEGKTTIEMKTQSTYTNAGWDFTNIWGIDEEISYPYLLLQKDLDGDGSPAYLDCNDNNSKIYPGATEICNGLDDNCNNLIDESLIKPAGNIYGLCSDNTQICSGGVWNNSFTNYIPVEEICDGLDNNCNGQIDEGVQLTFYEDLDEDGFGDSYSSIQACSAPEGYVSNFGDCNDINSTIYPGATEICNGLDDNCNNLIDEGFVDTDNDGIADCIDTNRDGDSFPDINDTCPLENSVRFDANKDGCIDRLVNFSSLINNIPNILISNDLKRLFTLEINLALKFSGRDRDKVAMVMLRVLIIQIESQRGKRISRETADMLIAYSNNVIAKIKAGQPF